MRWTNGLYKSTVHRVMSKPGAPARYSVPFFFSINYDAQVEALPERDPGAARADLDRGGKVKRRGARIPAPPPSSTVRRHVSRDWERLHGAVRSLGAAEQARGRPHRCCGGGPLVGGRRSLFHGRLGPRLVAAGRCGAGRHR